MATEKIENYSAAAIAEMKEAYLASPTKATVEALATKLGKSVRSVIAKLSMERVYVPAAKAAGSKREATKAEMVESIASYLGLPKADLESLEKASVPALKAVRAALDELLSEDGEGAGT